MGKGRRLLFASLLVIGLGMIAWLALRPVGPPESSYEGKSLSAWLEQYLFGSGGLDNPEKAAARKAVGQIGTNGIPYLLAMIQEKDSNLRNALIKLLHKQSIVRIALRSAEDRNWEVARAFEILGTNGSPAVPDLIQIFEAKMTASSRTSAAQALGGIGPGARAAVPLLLSNITDRNEPICRFAPEALGEIGAEPEKVVPVLVNLLADPDRVVRVTADHGLRAFGTPTLLNLLSNPDIAVRSAATNALKLVDPKAAAEAGVQ